MDLRTPRRIQASTEAADTPLSAEGGRWLDPTAGPGYTRRVETLPAPTPHDEAGAAASNPLLPGMAVRKRGDPSQQGTVTNQRRPGRGSRPDKVEVAFPGGKVLVPEDQLEVLPAAPEAPTDALAAGRLSPLEAVQRTLMRIHLEGRLQDTLYSLETTATDFYAHQYLPVIRLLESPTGRLLIADEVGLGKTIEAGLVWTELRARHHHRRLLVLCPAVLKGKWVAELVRRFGVDAEEQTPATLAALLENPVKRDRGFAAVCSLQSLRLSDDADADENPTHTDRLLRLLASEPQPLDLVVIDEAHHLRSERTHAHRAAAALRDASKHLLLLSATPVHNGNRDLQSLLRLIDEETFEFEGTLSRVVQARRPLLAARDALFRRETPERVAQSLREARSALAYAGDEQVAGVLAELDAAGERLPADRRADLAERLEAADPLAALVTRTRKREVQDKRAEREAHDERIDRTPAEADAYDLVSDAVMDYALRGDVNENFLLVNPQAQLASSVAATLAAWRVRLAELPDEDQEEKGASKPGPLTRFLLDRAHGFGDPAELEAEDTKYERLREKLRELIDERPREKIVLFSEYRATLDYLERRLAADGLPGVKMHGGVQSRRGDLVKRFKEDPAVRVLLCSRMGSEGIDLQFSRILVNYDLPWNPMRIEQRIGRLDRIGQEADKIEVWNLFHAGTIDDRIRIRLQQKLRSVRDAVGGFELILADDIKKLERQLLTTKLTPEEVERQVRQTELAIENRIRQEKIVEEEAIGLAAHGSQILRRIRGDQQAGPAVPADLLLRFVDSELKRRHPGTVVERDAAAASEPEANPAEDAGAWRIRLTPEAKNELQEWLTERRLPSDTRLLSPGAAAVRFATRVADGNTPRRDGRERIDQTHPLVRFAAERPEAERRDDGLAVALQCAGSALGPDAPPPGVYAVATSLFRFTPAEAGQLLVHAAAAVGTTEALPEPQSEALIRMLQSTSGRDWPDAAEEVDLRSVAADTGSTLFDLLADRFDRERAKRGPRHNDRLQTQRVNLNAYERGHLEKLAVQRDRHADRGNRSLVAATDGRMDKLRERVARRRDELARQPAFGGEDAELCVAVIRVTA